MILLGTDGSFPEISVMLLTLQCAPGITPTADCNLLAQFLSRMT